MSYKSYGAELSFNFNLMRYLILFDLGIRYAYIPEFKEVLADFWSAIKNAVDIGFEQNAAL